MPVRPPETPPRFDPIFLTGDDLEDLTSFTGLSREACLERVRAFSSEELAEAWRRTDPKTPKEIVAFYGSTDLYIWELMQWHASPARLPYWQALSRLVRHWPARAGWRRVLDFGCGVGTDGLYLATQGYDVTLVDVSGPTFEFAKHRFRRRGLVARFVESRSILPEPDAVYDVVVCFDVFEHLPDPAEAVRRLAAALRPMGILVQVGQFGDDGHHPCHLHENVERFGGLRWHIQLAGLGMRNAGHPLLYLKVAGAARLAQKLRFLTWRATGLWVVWTGR
ncbi:MAG: class I SAM-dependent methyltransferase [Armatimonadota bacterium]|nr:class I SAM-dependent methyltransferase [Armatimonadota bacterium]